MKSLAVAVLLYSLLTLGVQAIDVTVGQLGVVSGYQETENNVLINIFKGIPFAQPPVGNLRFARPQPLTTFPSPVVNATQPPAHVTQ
jgi:carboxylesterase type B